MGNTSHQGSVRKVKCSFIEQFSASCICYISLTSRTTSIPSVLSSRYFLADFHTFEPPPGLSSGKMSAQEEHFMRSIMSLQHQALKLLSLLLLTTLLNVIVLTDATNVTDVVTKYSLPLRLILLAGTF